MWKTLPVSSLNFFVVVVVGGGEGFFFPPSPSTSFLLWNVSNGQRLTSDWLNSKTISFVLMFLFENSYQFAQGKEMTIRSVSHTFEFQAGELQPPWVYRVFLGRKGVLRVAGCGHATCLDLTLLPSWLWIVNAFREGSRSFSSSAKLAAF